MSSSQAIQGIVSGFDTKAIIEQLMSIERKSVDKTSEKVQMEKLRLQAYQSVNGMLLSLKTSVNSLASQSLWNSKLATSSNETSLKATASSSATAGSYSFRVGQLAATAQYMTKGYTSSTSKVLSPGSGVEKGTITLESSKAKVDNSAKLEDLNGGKGIYRGSIRVTDAGGSSAVVDVSACETIDQVIKAINGAAGLSVEARIKKNADGTSTGNQLEIVDKSGGTGTLKIQNVGNGTTATDLGIEGISTNGSIVGSSIYYMSDKTSLSTLNDGLGIEDGKMCITVKGAGGEQDIYVDLSDMSSVEDVLNAVNSQIKEVADKHPDLVGDLRLAINDEGNGFTFTGGKAGNVYTVTNLWGQNANGQQEMAKPQTVNQLGLLGTYTVSNDGDSFGGKRILGDIDSPMLVNLSGANKTGIGSESSRPSAPGALNANTLLKNLNGGAGIDVASGFQIKFYEGGGAGWRNIGDVLDMDRIRAMTTSENTTLGDLVSYVNDCFANSDVPALRDVTLNIDSASKGLYFEGFSSAHNYEISGSLASSLGLDGTIVGGNTAAVSDLYSFDSIGTNGGANMILESTKLSELTIGGATITQAQLDAILVDGGVNLRIGGTNVSVDLSGLTGDSTVEEFYGSINAAIEAAGGDAFLAIDFTGMGLQWRNVDLDQDFEVTGAAADLFGLDKNYTGQNVGSEDTTVQKNLNPVVTGVSTQVDLAGGQLLSSLNGGRGLGFTGNQLTLTFGPEGNQSIVSVSRQDLLDALGGNFGSATVTDYVDALNNLFADKIANHATLGGSSAAVTFGVSADGKGITITSATGTTEGEAIKLGGDMATAASTGLGAYAMTGGSGFTAPEAADIRSVQTTETPITGLGYIKLDIGGTEVTLNTDGLDKYSTLKDLVGVLNQQLADQGYGDMSFGVSDTGTGLSFTNGSSHQVVIKYDEVSSLASDLGLVGKSGTGTDAAVSAKSHLNGSSVNRNYVSRATTLASLNGGAGADKGIITVTNAQGTTVNIDLSEALTMGDVIDAINGTLYGINARINDAGDGIVIEQTVFTDSSGNEIKGNISVANADGTSTADHLGLTGTGVRDENGKSVLDGSMKTVVEVGPNDTLADLRDRIGTLGGYTTAIINDGTGSNANRLSISAKTSGAGSDFIIDSDFDFLGLQQVSKGQDSILLYGQPNSGMSPVVLKSSSNTNNTAILGLTLELGEVSDSYTTITVKTDTEKVTEEIQNMVQAYNDMSDLITYLDSYDTENETEGILFGDTTIRTLMDTIDDMFYQVFNPDNLSYGDVVSSGKKSTWTWSDLGIGFSTNNTNSDGESGSWYSRMELDLDMLNDMVTNNWDQLYEMMASQRNASNSNLAKNAAASATFNFQYALDENGHQIKPTEEWNPNNAINGDKSSSTWGASSNGFQANKTIAEGENQYTVYFQGATTLDRVSIYHPSAAESLKDFTVEYLDANTGKWEVLREVSGNSSSSTILGVGQNTTAMAVRITASATNAEDGKFRLLDIQCLESTGLAGKLNQTVNKLTDVVDGYFTNANKDVEAKITDLQEQMEKMEERLSKKEESLWNKFNAMESALSQLNNQSNYLANMFASLNKSNAS